MVFKSKYDRNESCSRWIYKLAMPILLRMLTNNDQQVPNEDLCRLLSICILEYMARIPLFKFKGTKIVL